MERGDFELSGLSHAERKLAKQALASAKQLIGEARGLSPQEVSDQDVAEAFQSGGFSEWDAELAGRVSRALASIAGFEHA